MYLINAGESGYITYTLSNVSLSIYFNNVLINASMAVADPLHSI